MLKKLLIYCFLLLTVSLQAAIPEGYYDKTDGKNKGELKTALFEIIRYATPVGYNNIWTAFPTTDVRPDGSVWDMYSNQTYQFNGTNSVNGMHIEHSLPKSWWGGTNNQAYNDLNHLYPADATANIQKSNWTMAVIDGEVLFDNGVIKRGRSFSRDPLNSIVAWEPADQYKGDFARTYMYMVTCYQNFSTSDAWTNDAAMQLNINNHDTYPLFQDWTTKLLLAWHRADPVSAKELKRNELVYQSQGNRNPFIDCPLLAEYVWGDKKEEAFSTLLISGQPYIREPLNGQQIIATPVKMGTQVTFSIQILGYNLSESLSFSLQGSQAAKFTLGQKTMTAAKAQKGAVLSVTYKSDIMANDTVELSIASSEIPNAVKIRLVGVTEDTFELLTPLVGNDNFTIRWNPSADATDYLVSVFEMREVGEKGWVVKINEDFLTTPKLPTGWTQTGAVTTDQLSEVKLASGGNPGAIISPSLELGDSVSIHIKAKTYGADKNPTLTVACGDHILGTFITTATYQVFPIKCSTELFLTDKLSFSAVVNKRLVIDSICIKSYEDVETLVSLPDYPKIETSTTHMVDNLELGEIYNYTVQPQGGLNKSVYGPVQVVTGISASPNVRISTVQWEIISDGLLIHNLKSKSIVSLTDLSGRLLFQSYTTSFDTLRIPLFGKGIFILCVANELPIKIIKTR